MFLYRTLIIFLAECESLVRKMLVRDPAKRYTLAMVRKHPWIRVEVPQQVLDEEEVSSKRKESCSGTNVYQKSCYNEKLLSKGQQSLNEQVLRVMQSLGIDPARTTEGNW